MKSTRKTSLQRNINFGLKLGILGGGQLARMLAAKAQEQGFEAHILCPDANEPAAQVTQFWHDGNPNHDDDLAKFLDKVDFVTFESEFFDANKIDSLLNQTTKKTPVVLSPSTKILGKIQDRLSQKELLAKYNIPTAEFISIHEDADLNQAYQVFPKGFVLKLRTQGYDGFGTWIFKGTKGNLQSIGKRPLPNCKSQPCIAESLVKIKRELAVIFVRSMHNEIVQLPLVQTIQKDSRCDLVLGPVQNPKFAKLEKQIRKMLTSENYVGAIGFEFFETDDGILVNEMAPRVHNTGHYSQLALSEDQFSLHVKAVTGAHIEDVQILGKAFAMVNLIGQGQEQPTRPAKLKGSLHWYGKTHSKLGRKMGHVNYLGNSLSSLKNLALKERKGFKL